MTIYIKNWVEKNLYDSTHDYAEYSDFYYDLQNLVFFCIFGIFGDFFKVAQNILKTKIFSF